MKLYNTLTREFDEINAGKDKKLNIFVCGMTVNDFPHIGHARTFTFFDTLVRYLRFKGFKTNFLMNITDIDDKIIAKSKQVGMEVKEIVDIHSKRFFEDMKLLGVKVTKYAWATDYIPEIINQIKILLDKGYAYQTPSGVYFDVTKFKGYGKLSRQPLGELKVHRIEPDPTKRNIADFSLWKRKKPGEPAWESPFGNGRPGWHIEDTAIAMKFFGDQYSLHGGGIDLIFPHHEAEIAQAEAITGKTPYVKHWIHVAFLIIDGRKMSKSLGNVIAINEALNKNSPEILKTIFLQTHYKKELNYTSKVIETAKAYQERLKVLQERIGEITGKKYDKGLKVIIGKEKKKFFDAIDNDFDSPRSLTILFTLVKRIHSLIEQKKLGPKNVPEIKKFLKEIDDIFGIIPKEKKLKITSVIKKLVEEREKARQEKDFDRSDRIRIQLIEKGILLEDTPKGPKLRSA